MFSEASFGPSAGGSLPPKFEQVLAQISDAVMTFDAEWRFTYLNCAAAQLLAENQEVLLGKILWEQIPSLVGSKIEQECRRAAQASVTASFEDFYLPRGCWLAVSGYPFAGGFSVFLRDITVQKSNEKLLQVLTDRFQLAACSQTITLYEQDTSLRYTWLYPDHPEHAGAVGKTDLDLLPTGAGELLMEWKREILQSGETRRREILAPLRTGEKFYEVFALPKRNEANEIVGLAGVALDITERKQVEEAAQRLAAIVESSDDAIISKTLKGVVTSWNKSAERIFGYTADEIVGKSIMLLIPPDRQDEEMNIISRICLGERLEHFETLRRHKDGTLIPISLTISPIKLSDGTIVGASKIARNISRRKQIEEQQHALYELTARVNRAEALSEIYEAALDTICRCQHAPRSSILLCASDGTMRFEAWRGLSEAYRRAVDGHAPWLARDPDPKPILIERVADASLDPALRQVVEAEGIQALAFIPLTYERRLLGKFMVYYDTPHRFTEDELKQAQTIASQVAFAIERQKGEEALERLVNERTASLRAAIAQMEEFSYSVSHDLRSPARAMQGYAQAIIEDYGSKLDATGKELLQRIIRSSTRMDRLILDILTYSRLSHREIRLQPVSLERLVQEVIQQYPEMKAQRAEILIERPLLDVIGHEPSVSQVLSNLLSNAVKFVAKDVFPQVRVKTERRGDQVRLSVEDNGIGIRPEHQARVFGVFERILPDRHYEGTGIGLAIVRKAVERMNGTVGVESDGNAGSCFWVELPAA